MHERGRGSSRTGATGESTPKSKKNDIEIAQTLLNSVRTRLQEKIKAKRMEESQLNAEGKKPAKPAASGRASNAEGERPAPTAFPQAGEASGRPRRQKKQAVRIEQPEAAAVEPPQPLSPEQIQKKKETASLKRLNKRHREYVGLQQKHTNAMAKHNKALAAATEWKRRKDAGEPSESEKESDEDKAKKPKRKRGNK